MSLARLLHVRVDSAYSAAMLMMAPKSSRFFVDGIGDMALADAMDDVLTSICRRERPLPVIDDDIEWGKTIMETIAGVNVSVENGEFESPVAEFLPDKSETVYFQIVRPVDVPTHGIAILSQRTGNVSFSERRNKIAGPLAAQGVASILIMNVCCGPRRPAGQNSYYVRNVSLMLRQLSAAIIESACLVEYVYRNIDSNVKVVVAGISAGASVASAAGLLTRDHELAIVNYLGPVSTESWVTGVISSRVDWHSIAVDFESLSEEHAKQQLLAELRMRGLRRWKTHMPSSNSKRICISATACHDSYVDEELATDLHGLMVAVLGEDNCEQRFLDCGHVVAIQRQTSHFVPAVLDAISKLNQSS